MGGISPVRILADLTHAGSKAILIWAIVRNKSSEGVSLLTQLLYIIVFITRYVDLFWTHPANSFIDGWNFCFKIWYIVSSFFIVFLMLKVFPRTREKEASWRLAAWSLLGCLVTTPLVNLIYHQLSVDATELLWIFSIELESVCILPQLLLLRQTSVPTVLDSYYLVALGSYRLLYIISWGIKGVNRYPVNPISIIFGVIQTLFYLDFAWVYYTRQRVKLRGGAVVDSDDLGKSFLVRRIIGTESQNPEDDIVDDETSGLVRQEDGDEEASIHNASKAWGSKEVSVCADDTLNEHDRQGAKELQNPAFFDENEDESPAMSRARAR